VRIRILSVAEKDVEEGYKFYAAQDPDLGSYFLDCRRDPSWIRERLMTD